MFIGVNSEAEIASTSIGGETSTVTSGAYNALIEGLSSEEDKGMFELQLKDFGKIWLVLPFVGINMDDSQENPIVYPNRMYLFWSKKLNKLVGKLILRIYYWYSRYKMNLKSSFYIFRRKNHLLKDTKK